jgi:hypothetical protein
VDSLIDTEVLGGAGVAYRTCGMVMPMSATGWIGTVAVLCLVLLFAIQVIRIRRGGTYSTAYASIMALVTLAGVGGLLAVADADQSVITAFFTLAGTIAGLTANVVRDNQPTSSKTTTQGTKRD